MASPLKHLDEWLGKDSAFTKELEDALRAGNASDEKLMEAMAYSVKAGGKRYRPYLVYAVASAYGADLGLAAVPAVAVELVHTYSLVHDDLPAMDDDDLRRGLPTCHKAYGEALAIIAGDALQSRAFEILSSKHYVELAGNKLAVELVRELACAIGPSGMAGGQAKDMRQMKDPSELEAMHDMKTGAMIIFCTRAGALLAGCEDMQTSDRIGRMIGRAFQVRDDILDSTSSAEQMGKTPGKDLMQGKLTYVSSFGLDRSREILGRLIEDSKRLAQSMPYDKDALVSAINLLSL